MNDKLQIFENRRIRSVWDEKKEEWYFSVVDVVGALTDSVDTRHAAKYWNTLKTRLKDEGSQLSTNCRQLKMRANDGKARLTDAMTTEQILRPRARSRESTKRISRRIFNRFFQKERIERYIQSYRDFPKKCNTHCLVYPSRLNIRNH